MRNAYDDYGRPGPGNQGRFQYTGQMWLEEAGLYHYKARAYSPNAGRFLQTDPIGYADGLNLYAYVGNDPVNNADPTGLEAFCHPIPDGVKCYRQTGGGFEFGFGGSLTDLGAIGDLLNAGGGGPSASESGGGGGETDNSACDPDLVMQGNSQVRIANQGATFANVIIGAGFAIAIPAAVLSTAGIAVPAAVIGIGLTAVGVGGGVATLSSALRISGGLLQQRGGAIASGRANVFSGSIGLALGALPGPLASALRPITRAAADEAAIGARIGGALSDLFQRVQPGIEASCENP